jgi:nitrate ABC transporter ATP-binding subunit
MAFLKLQGVTKSYAPPKGRRHVLQGIDLDVDEGEFVAVVGYSGSGKTTLISPIASLIEPDDGESLLGGTPIDGRGPDRGIVFQTPALLPWLTARGNVLLAVEQISGRHNRVGRRRLADRYLARVGLEGVSDRYPDEMSAGMRQRVGIARAFALEPKVLLLDEPFSLLDALTSMELQDELVRLWEEARKTLLMVPHDVDEALSLSDRIVMMTSGAAATVGDILSIPFPRPRFRADVLNHPD